MRFLSFLLATATLGLAAAVPSPTPTPAPTATPPPTIVLTDQNGRTYGGCQWGPGAQHITSGEDQLCSPGWTHWYLSPELAVLLNPIHAEFADPQIWIGEGTIGLRDHQIKVGCVDGRTLRRITLPKVTTDQRVHFAILCALAVYKEPTFAAWAAKWVDRTDRTARAAEAAAAAAKAAEAANFDLSKILHELCD